MLPDGQPPTVAFTVLAQLCGPKANDTEIDAALFTKNGEGRNFDCFFFDPIVSALINMYSDRNATTLLL